MICSPTILYGVNFSEIHFDNIFGYYQTTILPGSVYQQLRRIRYVKDKKVYIHLKDKKRHSNKYYPTDIEELRTYIPQNKQKFSKIINNLNIVYDDGFKIDITDSFTNLYIYFISERHKANNNYLDELTSKINEWGGIVYIENKSAKQDKKYNDKKQDMTEELKQDKIEELLKANNDIHKYDAIRYKPLKNAHDNNIK